MTTVAAQPARRAPRPADRADLPPRWPWLFRLFRWYSRRYAAKHLHAVRVSRAGSLPPSSNVPLVIVLNHPSWWDPIVCTVLAAEHRDRTHWGPIEDAALRQYRFLSRVGMFGVETGTARGAVRFLRTTRAILSNPKATLWLTAQGRFADARQRPPGLRAGIGHLAATLDAGLVVPMAIELTFWTERTPEALVRFGPALDISSGTGRTPREWTDEVERALTLTQDELAAEAICRDPGRFTTLVAGRAGVGGIYDGWRRFKAALAGRAFQPEHARDIKDGSTR